MLSHTNESSVSGRRSLKSFTVLNKSTCLLDLNCSSKLANAKKIPVLLQPSLKNEINTLYMQQACHSTSIVLNFNKMFKT